MNDSIEKCAGCFLRYRSFPHDISPFSTKRYFKLERHLTLVCDENDVDRLFTDYCSKIDFSKTGIMLSGGIDSVLLASYMPRGSYAFTISYPEMKQKDEVEKAKHFADLFGLKLIVVPVTFEDVLKYQDELMKFKGQPLATIEIGIYKMCLEARKYGLTGLLSGMGADGTEGIKNLKAKKQIHVISQSQETCAVYGMPRAVATAGLSDQVVPLDQVAQEIILSVGIV